MSIAPAHPQPELTRPVPSLYWTRRPWYERRGHSWIEARSYEKVKRALDLTGGIFLLPGTLVALGLCWIAIKLDSPGPAFFTQVRTGRGGKRFRMFKLRTMVRDAEALKSSYMHLNELAYPDFKIAHDPRITRVGRILRKTSLDELPQVFNVLQGVMSLVGPRPTSFSSETYRLWHTVRLELKPGMTGLWQVSGRNELDFDDRVRLDVAYLRNRCLLLDLKVLARTFLAVFQGRGAN